MVSKTKKTIIFGPKYALNALFEALDFKIFRGSMPPEPAVMCIIIYFLNRRPPPSGNTWIRHWAQRAPMFKMTHFNIELWFNVPHFSWFNVPHQNSSR